MSEMLQTSLLLLLLMIATAEVENFPFQFPTLGLSCSRSPHLVPRVQKVMFASEMLHQTCLLMLLMIATAEFENDLDEECIFNCNSTCGLIAHVACCERRPSCLLASSLDMNLMLVQNHLMKVIVIIDH